MVIVAVYFVFFAKRPLASIAGDYKTVAVYSSVSMLVSGTSFFIGGARLITLFMVLGIMIKFFFGLPS